MEHFKTYVAEMTTEHTAKKGTVTCEFSTNAEDLEAKKAVLAEACVLDGYCWVMYYCDTCRGHHADTPVHVQIVNVAFWGENKVNAIEGLI